jgi:hypothetical protein
MRTTTLATADAAEPLTRSTRAQPILREVLLLGSMYVVYSLGRMYAARHSASAFDNAHRLVGWERDLSLPNEAALQHSFLHHPHLVQAANCDRDDHGDAQPVAVAVGSAPGHHVRSSY